MNAQTLLNEFDLIAEAPGGVAKLRQLILQLAIRGRLVPQDPSGRPKVRLCEVAERIHYGYTASANHSIGGVRMLRITDIQNNLVNWDSVPGCEINEQDVAKYELHTGDILIARTGGTIGKTYLITETPVRSVFASYLIRVIPAHRVLPQYLKLFLESPDYWEQLRMMSAGTGQPNVNGQALGSLVFELPLLAEQKRIIARVDELMKRCDDLEERQKDRNERRTALTASCLHAVTTPARKSAASEIRRVLDSFPLLIDTPESVAELRKTILQLAVQGRLGTQDPETWRTLQLEDMGDWAIGSGFPTHYQGVTDKEIPFCKVSDMNLPGNEMRIELTVNTVDAETVRSIGARVHPMGTVVFPKIGGAIATNKRRILTKPTAIDNNCLGLTPKRDCTTEWLYLVLSSIDFAAYQSGTSVPALAQGVIGKITVRLPSLAEQKRVVSVVGDLWALCDELEGMLSKSFDDADILVAALVHHLCNGGKVAPEDAT